MAVMLIVLGVLTRARRTRARTGVAGTGWRCRSRSRGLVVRGHRRGHCAAGVIGEGGDPVWTSRRRAVA